MTNLNDYTFGNFVCKLREERGLTQAEVANQLGVTAAAVSKWENGSSKPRVEILFRLADILGVRPEELMAGHYIEVEQLDPEAVRQINERYEHLRRIELNNTAGTKARRIVAWVIDWNIIGIAVLLLISVFMSNVTGAAEPSSPSLTLMLLFLMLLYPICFVLRDVVFGSCSLGKRIMGLTVLSKQTGNTPKGSQLFLRNIFLFLAHVDAIVMLATGLSLGDRVAHVVVVAKKDLENTNESTSCAKNIKTINQYSAKHVSSGRKKTVRNICIAVVAVVVFICMLVAAIFISLEGKKETEEYKLAYAYLVESETFAELGIEEDDVRLLSYNKTTTTQNGKTLSEVQFGFRIGFLRRANVVCHNEGNGWYVCSECTGFD